MDARVVRVLIVDDYEPWRCFIATALQKRPEFQIVREALDGLEAVALAEQLRPDLILLDIGLPKLNGIEAAHRISEVSPASKILFMSENRVPDIALQALRTGTGRYVVKSDAASEFLPAVEAVLEGRHFVSAKLRSHFNFTESQSGKIHLDAIAAGRLLNKDTCPHTVGFYSDDRQLLSDLTEFVGAALRAGNSAIVIATESHRDRLLAV